MCNDNLIAHPFIRFLLLSIKYLELYLQKPDPPVEGDDDIMDVVPAVSSDNTRTSDPPEVNDKLKSENSKNKNSSVDNERTPPKKIECINSANQPHPASPATFNKGALSPSSPAEDEYKKRHPKVNVGKISRQNRVASQVEIRNKKKQSKLQKRRERHNDFTRDKEYGVIAKDDLFNNGNVDDVQDTVEFDEKDSNSGIGSDDDSNIGSVHDSDSGYIDPEL